MGIDVRLNHGSPMRIVIDTSDDLHPVRLDLEGVAATPGAVDDVLLDGGAAPSHVGTGGGDVAPAQDSGPPPVWLLDAVAAAEAAGADPPIAASDEQGTLVSDAGPGPTSYDT